MNQLHVLLNSLKGIYSCLMLMFKQIFTLFNRIKPVLKPIIEILKLGNIILSDFYAILDYFLKISFLFVFLLNKLKK
ncbi:MAG: hypothetical protein A2309_05530 [Bacteroidetes bacterium RIFOXYB2_FULL_35_7]|nr:MAG: hypothetical protein A2309_05530 [Bacteroidetes bacterium RIFOXYB2_FULL_35_7]OFZ04209.1 MAG: hypothetical protein A2491_18105 [Bacteroidetes bacterium RIFOXYC12_FULL_35_7]